MTSQRRSHLNLNTEYPCPCCREGYLQTIVLTEALGCDHCQKIFVLQADEQSIEELATIRRIKRSWRWTGDRWRLLSSANGLRSSEIWSNLSLILIYVAFWILILRSLVGVSKMLLVFSLVLLLPWLLWRLWLAWRR
ncbi:MAG: hypothetical protein AAGG02_02165 [Cyanobacteria bacterium P01_H01_bin.15]